MTVYFASAKFDPSTVKIGVTSNLNKRQGALSGGIPGGIVILATLPGGQDVEAFLHDKFEVHRLNGEWFTFSEEIKDFVRSVKNGKAGLIPFEDMNIHKSRKVGDYSAEAVNRAKEMAKAILMAEHRGPGDTIEAVFGRIEARTGLSAHALRRMRYREKSDIWAGEYLMIKDIYDALEMRGKVRRQVEQTKEQVKPERDLYAIFNIRPVYAAVRAKIETAAANMERRYEQQRDSAADTRLRRLADAVAGREEKTGERGQR
jgi:hypothetical protein